MGSRRPVQKKKNNDHWFKYCNPQTIPQMRCPRVGWVGGDYLFYLRFIWYEFLSAYDQYLPILNLNRDGGWVLLYFGYRLNISSLDAVKKMRNCDIISISSRFQNLYKGFSCSLARGFLSPWLNISVGTSLFRLSIVSIYISKSSLRIFTKIQMLCFSLSEIYLIS